MKKTSLTLILVVLLMTTLCLSTFAQGTWTIEEVYHISDHVDFYSVEFVNNNTVFIGGSRDADAMLYKWDLNTGTSSSLTFPDAYKVSDLAISQDKSYIMYAKGDGTVGSRFTSDMAWRAGFDSGLFSQQDLQLAFADTRDGHEILVVGGNHATFTSHGTTLQVWQVATTPFTRQRTQILADKTGIKDLETSLYVDEFFAADSDSNADIYKTDLSLKWAYGAHDTRDIVTALAFNWETDADRLAYGTLNGNIKIYSYTTYLRTLLTGQEDRVMALDFSPTDWDILACITSTNLVIWDINGEGVIIDSWLITDPGQDVAFSPNGRYFASANGKTVKIWRNTGGLAAPSANAQPEKSPEITTLHTNYPNPFNPETWIPYQLAKPAEVRVSIYSADGKLVRTLELGQLPAGVYRDKSRAAHWDGKNEQGESVASGVYFYTLKAGDFAATKKMLIRK